MLQILPEFSVPPNAHDIRQEAWTMETSKCFEIYTCLYLCNDFLVSFFFLSANFTIFSEIWKNMHNKAGCKNEPAVLQKIFKVWTTADLNLNCSMAVSCVCEYYNLRQNWLFCLSSLLFLITLMYVLRNALTISCLLNVWIWWKKGYLFLSESKLIVCFPRFNLQIHLSVESL